ncbi:hypothetical protein ACNQF7_02185 [Flavobacterium sp. RSP29]|uniref:hypothetical protein n=1 Tax=Flavobacterium sp. RSP29 TaxID=3401731 RepID=UPI003AAA6CF4
MRTTRLFKTVITYLLLMILILSLNSCFIAKSIEAKHARAEFTTENKAIPPSFGKSNTILLCVLQGRNSYDKFLKSAVKKNYKGEYILIYSYDLSSDKYSDKNKYRYVFDYNSGSSIASTYRYSSPYSTVNSYSNATTTYKRFYVNDRLENKIYQSGAEFGFFANAMKIYMANLEIERQSK